MLMDISLTPLIDTALTLLIIFMVATPMMQNAIRVTLPKGKAQEAGATQQEIVVYVDEHGTIFFDGNRVAFEQLVEVLKKNLAGKFDQTVFVKADQRASYGKVIELVDTIKVVGGVTYVALATAKQG